MKVYLAFPSRFDSEMGEFFKRTAKIVKKRGHKLSLELPWFNANEKVKEERKISEQEFFEKDIQAIDSSDALIADITLPSSGVGYQIAYAVSQKKPVLCMYYKAMTRGISKLIKSISSEMVDLVAYDSASLEKVVFDYLDGVDVYNLTKFNFLISPKIKHYLDWVEKTRHQSKSQFLRNAVCKRIIDQDKEYQEYLKQTSPNKPPSP